MSKETTLLFGGVGSVLGFAIGTIIELSSPDGFSCLPSSWPTEATVMTPALSSFFGCWVIVLFCTAILGIIGTALGALSSQIGGHR